ncbi:hypothetical protein OGAPHI_002385 [Ogataea philodendri]|uniref:Uncharacterized protein n=1 Tax=Ogataea philodendri TaxID=1378263 RepID=A0A9P8T849_9ASCO|nr:uncharacterized protein OGAPHI_002385 [Ogataea philodendri]KAH3668631.1 hypothetical protein OGAPHI_002385 [Ogataea philodendri]
MDGFHQQTVGALQLVQNFLRELIELQVVVFVEIIFEQLGNNFSIGVGIENIAFTFQKGLQFSVIGDDTIMDHDELVFRVGRLRMAVQLGDSSVGGPSSVSNTNVVCKSLGRVQVMGLDLVLEIGHLADLLVDSNLLGWRRLVKLVFSINTNSRRVISPIFQFGKTFHQSVDDLTSGFAHVVVGVTKNTTETLVSGGNLCFVYLPHG